MRYRIMDMKQIQPLHFGYLGHFGRQRQIIRRITEHIIIVNLNLMIKYILLKRS
ncbi:hypothetical protein D3C71_2177520 [compost metagenome]